MAHIAGDLRDRENQRKSWLSALSRVTSSGAYIPEVDGLRFVAIALVVMVHVHLYVANSDWTRYAVPPLVAGRGSTAFLRLIGDGQYGVELFFVISGFVLALPFAAHYFTNAPAVRFRTYLLRRLTRLEPPYLLAMLLLTVLTIGVNRRGISSGAILRSFAVSSVYLHSAVFGGQSIVSFVTWSLEIEVQFYLLVPALTKVFAIQRRWLRRFVIVAIAFSFECAQHWLHFESSPRLYFSVLNFAQYFLAGMLLADLYVQEWQGNPTRSIVWDIVTLAGWPAMFAILSYPRLVPWLLAPYVLLLYIAAFRGVITRRFLSNRVVTTIGGMCYSIYLLHVAVISGFGRLTMRLGSSAHYEARLALQAMMLFPLILSVTTIFFVCVERPCMRRDWPQSLVRFLSKARPARTDGPQDPS